MLVSRVAAPPVLSRDLHSRIRCVSRVTSAHRFAAIAGRRPTTRRPGLPGSTRSHRSRREALQLESLPFPAVSRQLFAPGRKFEIAIRIVKEQCQRRVRHDSDPVLTPGNEKAPVGEPTGALCPRPEGSLSAPSGPMSERLTLRCPCCRSPTTHALHDASRRARARHMGTGGRRAVRSLWCRSIACVVSAWAAQSSTAQSRVKRHSTACKGFC